MSGQRSGRLTDEALDREIRAALAIAPPPGFRARIRTRVAAAGPPRRVFLPLSVRAAAVAASLVAIAVASLLWRGGAAPDEMPGLPARMHAGATAVVPLPAVPRGSGGWSAAVAAPVTTGDPAAPRARPAPEPEVLVPPEEIAALQQLLAAASRRPIRMEPWPPAEGGSDALPGQMAIPPITIEPIDVSRPSEGVLP